MGFLCFFNNKNLFLLKLPKKRIKNTKKTGGLVFAQTLITFQSFFVIFP